MKIEPPSTNGSQTAPGNAHGVVVLPERGARPAATVFPAALPGRGPDAWLFALGRGSFFGIALQRVVVLAVVFVAIGLVLLRLPGSGWAALALLGALGIVVAARSLAARRNYVRFAADAADAADAGGGGASVDAEPLLVREKLPVYIWGRLEVEGRVAAFAALPGFYRTFANREHAVIGQATSAAWLGVAALTDLDEGLWYAFCAPGELLAVRTGAVRWGGGAYPALRLQRRTARKGANGRLQHRIETLYLAVRDAETLHRILADLAVEGTAAGVQDARRVASARNR